MKVKNNWTEREARLLLLLQLDLCKLVYFEADNIFFKTEDLPEIFNSSSRKLKLFITVRFQNNNF